VPLLALFAWASAGAASSLEDDLVPPTLIDAPAPAYPWEALLERVGGDVVMDIDVRDDGLVSRVAVTSAADARLAWAAMGAVTNFVFVPAHHHLDDGSDVAVAVRLGYTMTFEWNEQDRQRLLAQEASAVPEPEANVAAAELAERADPGQRESVVKVRRREVVSRTLTQSTAQLDQAALSRVRGRSLAATLTELPGVV
jgi:Gram-negative bacterial TonB protein C-terminal